MALVIYECDTCKRQIEKQRNEAGLDIINNCVITNGCKGVLHLVNVNLQHNTPSTTPSAEGLEDWVQRKILYTHTQEIISDRWRVVHNLSTKPTIKSYVYLGQTGELTKVEPRSINLINENVTELVFHQPYTGIAQATSLSSTEGQKVKSLLKTESAGGTFTPITALDEIIIATKYENENISEDYVDLTLTFLNPSTSKESAISSIRFENVNTSSAWGDGNRVAINGELFKLRSQTLNTNELTNLKIQNGSPFFISEITYGTTPVNSLPADSVYVMLTSSPYQIFDKILDRALDASLLTKENAPTQTSLIDKRLNVKDNFFQRIFPYINIIV